jgi:exosortase
MQMSYPLWRPSRTPELGSALESELRQPTLGMSMPETEINLDSLASESAEVGRSTWGMPVLVQVAGIGILLALLYHGILRELVRNWVDDPNYSHGFFVLLFCAWLLWQRRAALRAIPQKPSALGLVVIGGALALLILGVLGAELFLSRTSLLFLVAGLVVYFSGWKMFRALLLPWGLLFLAIPLPMIVFNQIAFPLQFGASRLASALLAFLGVPVLREGNIIMLPSMSLDVAEACSGLRSLMALVSIGVLYGCIFEPRVSRRLWLALAAIPIAVVANAVRIATTGLLGQYWGPDKAEGFFHVFSGGLIFLCTLLLLLAFHLALKRLGKLANWRPS